MFGLDLLHPLRNMPRHARGQRRDIGRQFIAPPGNMQVGPDKDEISLINVSDRGAINFQNRKRCLMRCKSRCQLRGIHNAIAEPEQSITRSQDVK
jgi:hypothetical protein